MEGRVLVKLSTKESPAARLEKKLMMMGVRPLIKEVQENWLVFGAGVLEA